MEDKMGAILENLAVDENARIDYDAMRAAILTKAKTRRRQQGALLRYASAAAAVVVFIGAGAAFFARESRLKNADMNAMGSFTASGVTGFAADGEPAPAAGETEESVSGAAVTGQDSAPREAAAELNEAPMEPPVPAPDASVASIAGDELPSACTVPEDSGLLWGMAGVSLPPIDYTKQYSVESAADFFRCTVSPCTEDDAREYFETAMALFYPGEGTVASADAAGAYSALLPDGHELTVAIEGEAMVISLR